MSKSDKKRQALSAFLNKEISAQELKEAVRPAGSVTLTIENGDGTFTVNGKRMTEEEYIQTRPDCSRVIVIE